MILATMPSTHVTEGQCYITNDGTIVKPFYKLFPGIWAAYAWDSKREEWHDSADMLDADWIHHETVNPDSSRAAIDTTTFQGAKPEE